MKHPAGPLLAALALLSCDTQEPPPPLPPPVEPKEVVLEHPPPPPPEPEVPRWKQAHKLKHKAKEMATRGPGGPGMEMRWKVDFDTDDLIFRRMVCHEHKEGLVCSACYHHPIEGNFAQLDILCEWDLSVVHHHPNGTYNPLGGCMMLFTIDRWTWYGIDPKECRT